MFGCVDEMLLTMALTAPLLRRWLVAGALSKRHHAATGWARKGIHSGTGRAGVTGEKTGYRTRFTA
jgi:hypothetical protein